MTDEKKTKPSETMQKTMTLKGALSDAYGKGGKNGFINLDAKLLKGKTLIVRGDNGSHVYVSVSPYAGRLSVSLPAKPYKSSHRRGAPLRHLVLTNFDDEMAQAGVE